MPFSTPRSASTSYLILRHLYDGDVIDWPLPEDHPLRPLFDALVDQGYIARWDRIWPLTDRYRLTEKGIAALEAVYRPSGAEAFLANLRAQNLSPKERRAHLAAHRLDPVIWPILHDPYTHWSTVAEIQGQYYAFFWADQRPPRRNPVAKPKPAPRAPDIPRGGGGVVHVHHHHHHHHHDPTLVDLDNEEADRGYIPPPTGDYDMS